MSNDNINAFINASKDGNSIEVIKLLSNNPTIIDKKDKTGTTALMWSSYFGHVNIVRILLYPNIFISYDYVDVYNNPNSNLLIFNKTPFIELKCAEINRKNNYGNTSLILASMKGHYEVVTILLNAMAYVNETNNYKSTALIEAIGNHHINVVKLLLQNNADYNLKDINNNSALTIAESNNNIDAIKLFTKPIISIAQSNSYDYEQHLDISSFNDYVTNDLGEMFAYV
jgi:ankyrin repeat protein